MKHFDVSQLPSLKAGMSAEEESVTRRKTCRFIEEAGKLLKLPRVAIATAMVFFHRFYAKHSFHEHDRFEVAVASIVLAAKTEESPKKLNTVIDECYKLKQGGMTKSGKGPAGTFLDPKGEEFGKLKERILLLERIILHTIGFELSIVHPYILLVEQIKKLIHNRQLEYISQSASSPSTSQTVSKMLNELVQYSMNFANDSFHTSLCLQFSPQLIAAACVYLAGHFTKVRPANQQGWLSCLGVPEVEAVSLSSACAQIIELIVDRRGSDMQAFAAIRADLEKLKDTAGAGSCPPLKRPMSPQRPPPPPAQSKPAPDGGAKRPRTS